MISDPHEIDSRLESYRKIDSDEMFFGAINRALASASLPSKLDALDSAENLPVIYIVGVPRSGTTLLSQLLSRQLPIGYIDNLVARFWGRPSVGIRLSRALLGVTKSELIDFDSRHGTTAGFAGPHEFGYFWRKWLLLDSCATHKLRAVDLARVEVEKLKRTLREEILQQFNCPVVFKNVICGFQAELLTRVHPNSLFIWIRRDAEDVVRSILKCRMERYGRYDAWWSLKPSTYSEIARIKSPVEQVIRQVTDCSNEFEQELSKPSVRSINIEYEALISNPGAALLNICAAVKEFGFQISPLLLPLPSFCRPALIRHSSEVEKELSIAFRKSD